MDEPRFDLEQIRAIIALAEDAGLAELTVESGGAKISVRRAVAAARTAEAVPAREAATRPGEAAPAARRAEEEAIQAAFDDGARLRSAPLAPGGNHLQPITAPMVGTFYRAANPEAPPFVEEGDQVEPGQTVCIIEAMKLFNEIQSEIRGRVVRVLAENGAPVEYGQPLFLVDPRRDGA